MRLIDISKINAIDLWGEDGDCHVVYDYDEIHNAPTVEAIPKADYEARLKADLKAMLTELQLEIENTVKEEEPIDKKWASGLHYSEKIIQQKIDALKAESEVENENNN